VNLPRYRPGERAWLPLAYTGSAVYFTWPFLTSGTRLGVQDWDAILFHHASVLKSVYEYGQLPFWNPWYCGGNVLWANPQVPLLTPTFLFALIAPVAVAMKLNVLLHYLIGFGGMHLLLTRVIGLTWRPVVFFLAAQFVFAGAAALHLIVGHGTFLSYFHLPWLLFFFIRAIDTLAGRYVVAAAGVFAVGVLMGGLHVAFMAGVAMGCFAAAAAASRRQWRPLIVLALVATLAALFAAPKLVPFATFLSNPELVDIRFFVERSDRVTANMLQVSLLDGFQYPRMTVDDQGAWHEYGNYLGPLGVPLIAGSFVWLVSLLPWSRAQWLGASLAFTAAALFVLMLGDHGPYSPYMLLRRVPLLSQFRLPSRFTLVWVLFATTMVAWAGRTVAAESILGRRARALVAITLVASAGWLAHRNRFHMGGAFTQPPLASPFRLLSRPAAPVIDAATDGFAANSPMLRAMMDHNRAVLRCNEPLQLPGEVDPRQSIVFADTGVAVSRVIFGPRRIEFGVVSRDGGRVFLNQRRAPGWASSVGPLSLDPRTRLAYVTVAPGAAGRVVLRYVPPGLFTGVALFAAGATLSALLWRRAPGGTRASTFRSAAAPQS
jgi:hypothetical protein